AMAGSLEDDFGGAAAKAGGSMTGLLNSLGDLKSAGLRELFSSTFQAIQEPLGKLIEFLQSGGTIAAIRQFGQVMGQGIGQVILWLKDVVIPGAIRIFQEFGPRIMDAFAFLAAVA